MKKDTLATLSNALVEFTFDLDPYMGMTESEMWETTVSDLEEDGRGAIEFLNDIISHADDYEDEIETAKSLLKRVETFVNENIRDKNRLELMTALESLMTLGFSLERNSARSLVSAIYEMRDTMRRWKAEEKEAERETEEDNLYHELDTIG